MIDDDTTTEMTHAAPIANSAIHRGSVKVLQSKATRVSERCRHVLVISTLKQTLNDVYDHVVLLLNQHHIPA